MSKQTVVVLLIIAVISIAAWSANNTTTQPISTQPPTNNTPDATLPTTYVLASQGEIMAVLTYTTANRDTLTINDGATTTTLHQTRSGSGARYANTDESVIWWEHAGGGTLTMNGTTITIDTITPATNRRVET